MKRIYNITTGQFITLWVFGAIGWFWALETATRLYYSSNFGAFMAWFIPFALIFYSIGWRKQRKTNNSSQTEDRLYVQAREVAMQEGKVSTFLLQRRLQIGYSRAARLMVLLEKNGVIEEAHGGITRKVIVDKNGD